MHVLPTPDKRVEESTVNLLRGILERAELGEIKEVTIHYRTIENENFLAESFTLNRHEAAGWLLDMAIERLK